MALNDALAKLAEMMGLKPSEVKKNELLRDKMVATRAQNVDKIEAIKDEIRTLESRALKKKKELDAARGDSKRIVAGEIERTFRDLDRLRGRETILNRNIERLADAITKFDEAVVAGQGGVTEDDIDTITTLAQDSFGEAVASDKASRDMQKVKYEAPESTPVDMDQRMGEVEGNRETDVLSPEIQKKLKALETDE